MYLLPGSLRETVKTIRWVLIIFSILIPTIPNVAYATTTVRECHTAQSVTIGIDSLAIFETQGAANDNIYFVVNGDVVESGLGVKSLKPYEFEEQLLPPRGVRLSAGGTAHQVQKGTAFRNYNQSLSGYYYYCLGDGDPLNLTLTLMNSRGKYRSSFLGEMQISVVNYGDDYEVIWCTWSSDAVTLYNDSLQRVQDCHQSYSTYAYIENGGALYGLHLSTWFAVNDSVIRPYANGRIPNPSGLVNSKPNDLDVGTTQEQPVEQPKESITSAAPAAAAPQPGTVEQMLAAIRNNRSGIANRYPTQAEQLAQGLNAHLADFRVDGNSSDRMAQILSTDDAAMRMIAAVNGIWGDWDVNLCQKYGWNHYSEEPAGKVTPFRQLIIRLIQGRQGQLSDAEQRALESYFTRQEDADAWQNNMKGIVGAINRAYFP